MFWLKYNDMEYKFKDLYLKNNGVILLFYCKKLQEIPFSEIEKVHISIHKKPKNYKAIWIGSLFFFIGLHIFFLLYIPFAVIFLFPMFLIAVLVIKDYYNQYQFKIVAKNGDIFFKKISNEFKYDTLLLIESIRKKI
jgi:hypothetical protein